MNNKSNNIIKGLTNIVSHNYHKSSSDIIKIKDMIADCKIGTVNIFANRFIIVKPNEVDEDIHISFPFDTKKYGSFTISYDREKNTEQTDKSSIEKKYLDELYITKRNGIRKVMPLTDNNKEHFDKVWERAIGKSLMDKDAIEHHLVINPKIENYDGDKLLELFRDFRIKFYRTYLGRHFNEMKEEQIEFFVAVEYGKLYELTGKKDTHLHIILKTKNKDMLNEFHKSIESQMKKYFGERIDYQYKLIDTLIYRLNVYNYILKEGNECYTHSDFFYKKVRKKAKKRTKNKWKELNNPLLNALLDK